MPNTELGHLELDGHDAETRASDAARKRDDLSWSSGPSAGRAYIDHVDPLLRPDLVVLGGGVSKKSDAVAGPARGAAAGAAGRLLNDAGIVGAAVLAAER